MSTISTPHNRIIQDLPPNPTRRYVFRVCFGHSRAVRGTLLTQIRVRFVGMNVASGPELAR